MRIVDLSMTVEECDSAPFAPDETYFKIKPIINWEEKGFVSNLVEMTVHAGTHIDSPHHFFRDMPSVEQLPLEPLMGTAVVLDLSFRCQPRARITPEDMERGGGGAGGAGGHDRARGHTAASHRLAQGGIKPPIRPGGTTRRSCPGKRPNGSWTSSPRSSATTSPRKRRARTYQHADEILDSGMTVHRTILPKVTCQIENLINLDQIGATAKIIALPVKWKTESAPARGGGAAGLMPLRPAVVSLHITMTHRGDSFHSPPTPSPSGRGSG